MSGRLDAVIVGAGQAGLAMGRELAHAGRRFVIVDGSERVGDSWRSRWSSLRLFTPARYSGLPGLPFPAEPEHMPGKDEVADYLESYARHFALPVYLDECVHTVRTCLAGGFIVATSTHVWETENVIVATGPFQSPAVPRMAQALQVPSLHSSEYREPSALPAGPVLVVGGGNSGVQIAAELAADRTTWLSVGERLPRLPERVLGRSVFWWLERTGALDVAVDSKLGRRMRSKDTLIGKSVQDAARAGVRVTGRTMRANRNVVLTADARLEVSAVIWATGFRSDYHWLRVPVLDREGRPVQRRGATHVPGLWFLGLPWQHTRGSSLLGWVGRDAAWIAARINGSSAQAAA